jgi:transcriptional regulator with XRE-family HTH domain
MGIEGSRPQQRRGARREGATPSPVERLREALRRARPDQEERLFSEIADQVVQLRERWGLSQRELAELCGTTQSAIARMERGLRPPRIDTLIRVATALDAELVIEIRPRTEPRQAAPTRRRGEGRPKRRE